MQQLLRRKGENGNEKTLAHIPEDEGFCGIFRKILTQIKDRQYALRFEGKIAYVKGF